MFGLPGGSPGSDAETGCLGLFIIGVVAFAAVASLLGLLLYATREIGVAPSPFKPLFCASCAVYVELECER